MAKQKNALVTHHASLAGSAMERLTVAMGESLKAQHKANNGDGRTFQMVVSGADVTALLTAPGVTVQYRNGEFAVDMSAARKE